jgi:hypothetical protein
LSADTGSIWFGPGERERLDLARCTGSGARIWRNLLADAKALAPRRPRTRGIDPIAEDPDYENLYDRFYAIMSDGAELEHLSFAARLSGRGDLRDAAERRLTALTRAWKRESGRPPDYGSAYATSRLLRAAAAAIDLCDPWLDPVTRS